MLYIHNNKTKFACAETKFVYCLFPLFITGVRARLSALFIAHTFENYERYFIFLWNFGFD